MDARTRGMGVVYGESGDEPFGLVVDVEGNPISCAFQVESSAILPTKCK
jgi:hypothetical protein